MPRAHVAIAIAALLSACNGLFYYPMVGTLTTPAALDLAYDDVRFTAEGGVSLHAWRIHARGAKRGTVLHFHGNGENMTSHFLYVAWLADAGYEVIVFDYRGYGASDGEPEREGLVADARAALRFAAAGGGDLFIVAQSLGGAVAVPALVAERPENLRAVALDSTFSSYRGIARRVLASHWFSWPLQVPLSYLVSDAESPRDAAAQFTWPVVVLHAPGDPVAPYAEGRELFAALASKDKEFWPVDAPRHTYAFSDAEPAQAFRPRLLAFFARHASVSKAPPAPPGSPRSPGTRRNSSPGP